MTIDKGYTLEARLIEGAWGGSGLCSRLHRKRLGCVMTLVTLMAVAGSFLLFLTRISHKVKSRERTLNAFQNVTTPDQHI